MLAAVCMLNCAQVWVDGLATPDARAQTRFEVVTGKAKSEPDLLFQEFADEVGRALTVDGFEAAKDPDDATVSVALTWSVAKGGARKTAALSTAWVRVALTGDRAGLLIRLPDTAGAARSDVKAEAKPRAPKIPHYSRTITLKAYDRTAGGKGRNRKELWQTTLVSEGTEDDMRIVAPIMLAAAVPYLAQNTVKAIAVKVGAKSDMVRYIHGQIPLPPTAPR